MADSQNAPEILPELSESATRLNRKKLNRVPFNHEGKHPGKRWAHTAINLMFEFGNRAIFRNSESDLLPETKGGVIYVSTHINGLVDPMLIARLQRKRIISLGRHDLTTRPVIGWWARRFGTQPVLRKAEVEAGIVDADYARYINDRGMLTVASCLATGHSAVVMPEGKSHQDSQLHALRSGSFRAALAASAIADEKGLPAPVIQPVGLHWRTHHWLRTDNYVEFGQPLVIPSIYSTDDRKKLASGEWVEPSYEDTNELRNRVFQTLSPMTPDSPDWETYRAWKLLAHVGANKTDTQLHSLSEEVHATRDVRDSIGREINNPMMEQAKEAAEILHKNDLYANSLNRSNRLRQKTLGEQLRGILGLILMLITLPITLPSSGIQWALAKYMAESSDEGLDSRTTYFMLAGMFSPVFFWPPAALLGTYLYSGLSMDLVTLYTFILLNLCFYLAASIALSGYDLWTDLVNASNRKKLSQTKDGDRFHELVDNISSRLGALK